MVGEQGIQPLSVSASPAVITLTARQAQVLQLAGQGLSSKQIARQLAISVRTVEDHFSAVRRRTGARSRSELIAYWTAAGLIKPGLAVPETAASGTTAGGGVPLEPTRPGTACRDSGTVPIGALTTTLPYDDSVRIGYARVSTWTKGYHAQLDALGAAHCREIVLETASTCGDRPKLRGLLDMLQPSHTLVIYKPDRVARSMNELLVLLENLRTRRISLHILTGICSGIHRPDGVSIADGMLFTVAAMAAEMERDLGRERTLGGLYAAAAQERRVGRPNAVNDDVLAIAHLGQSRRRVGCHHRAAPQDRPVNSLSGHCNPRGSEGSLPGKPWRGESSAAPPKRIVHAKRRPPCAGLSTMILVPGGGDCPLHMTVPVAGSST